MGLGGALLLARWRRRWAALADCRSPHLTLPAALPTLFLTAVDGGERAVMYDRIQGVLEEPIGEGMHVRIPWFQTPNIMDIRTRPRSISSVTGTKGEEACLNVADSVA